MLTVNPVFCPLFSAIQVAQKPENPVFSPLIKQKISFLVIFQILDFLQFCEIFFTLRLEKNMAHATILLL